MSKEANERASSKSLKASTSVECSECEYCRRKAAEQRAMIREMLAEMPDAVTILDVAEPYPNLIR